MAAPILLDVPYNNPPSKALQDRLEAAPMQHAEALLDAYEVLQLLHERGLIDMARGFLGSEDKVLEIAVDAAKTPDSIRAMRNLVVLFQMLGSIDPKTLQTFTKAVPDGLRAIHAKPRPTGLWRLIKDFLWNQHFRHGLGALNTLLESFGQSLEEQGE